MAQILAAAPNNNAITKKDEDNEDADIKRREEQEGRASDAADAIAASAEAYRLYFTYFFSAWGARMWEFAGIVFIMELYPSTLIASSIFGLMETLVGIFGSSRAGQWIDTRSRLFVLRLSIMLQNVSVVIASVILGLALLANASSSGSNNSSGGGQLAAGAKALVLAAVIAAGMAARLGAIVNKMSLQKDWLVVMATAAAQKQADIFVVNPAASPTSPSPASPSLILGRKDRFSNSPPTAVSPRTAALIETVTTAGQGAALPSPTSPSSSSSPGPVRTSKVIVVPVAVTTTTVSANNNSNNHNDNPLCAKNIRRKAQTALNARLRRVDMACSIKAPMLVGLLSGFVGPAWTCAVVALWAGLSTLIELQLSATVYASIPALAAPKKNASAKKKETADAEMQTNKNSNANNSNPQAIILMTPAAKAASAAAASTATMTMDSPTGGTLSQQQLQQPSLLERFLLKPYRTARDDLAAYRRHPCLSISVPMCLLYMSVLSFGGIMVSYLRTIGCSDFLLALGRGIAALVAIVATFVVPVLIPKRGLFETGRMAIWLQIACLVPLVVGFAVGLDHHPTAAATTSSTLTTTTVTMPSSTYGTSVNVAPLLNSSASTAGSGGGSTSTTPLDTLSSIFWKLFFNIDFHPTSSSSSSSSTAPSYSSTSEIPLGFILIVFISICLSRFGLWGFDLAQTQMMQELVHPDEAGKINGAQELLTNVCYLGSFLQTIIFSNPATFAGPATISFAAVLAGGIIYARCSDETRRTVDHPPEHAST